eukprot:4094873-Heterocapsa_arctica.AAC.1
MVLCRASTHGVPPGKDPGAEGPRKINTEGEDIALKQIKACLCDAVGLPGILGRGDEQLALGGTAETTLACTLSMS